MNHLISLRAAAIAGLVFTAPGTGFTKDHHHHDSDHGHAVYVQPYCAPSYGYGYRSYDYGYRPYSYSRPSVSLGFYSAPSYYSSRDYDDDYYPTRSYYRGIPRTSYSYSYRSSNRSSSDELAVDVQRALARRGFYRGGIDGDIGSGTRAAIRAYQYNHGLEVTGRIDGTLLRSLGIS